MRSASPSVCCPRLCERTGTDKEFTRQHPLAHIRNQYSPSPLRRSFGLDSPETVAQETLFFFEFVMIFSESHGYHCNAVLESHVGDSLHPARCSGAHRPWSSTAQEGRSSRNETDVAAIGWQDGHHERKKSTKTDSLLLAAQQPPAVGRARRASSRLLPYSRTPAASKRPFEQGHAASSTERGALGSSLTE